MKRRVLLGAVVAGVLVLVLLPEETPSHARFQQGDCNTCHDAAPNYHTGGHWGLTHGRVAQHVGEQCVMCHSQAACRTCHFQSPATHTASFRSPGAATADGERHARLGRIAPSTCLVCHRSFLNDCATCHSMTEVMPWMDRGRSDLDRWQHMLGEY